MDPITAVGLAAAIVQFIEISAKVSKRLRDFSSSIDDVPKAFQHIRARLPLIDDGLQRIHSNITASTLTQETREALELVVDHCLADTKELLDILDKALPPAGASSWERRYKALASFRYDKRTEQIAESLAAYINTLTFHQVIRNSQSQHAEAQPLSSEKAFWLVPFDRNGSFVGREQIFDLIDEALLVPKGSQPKATLCGLGGIGKSQIALEYCYRRKEADTRCSVFWVNGATVARFEESYNRIAIDCGLVNREDAATAGATLVKDWLELNHLAPWLMVVDNVDDADAFFKERTRAGKTPFECIPRCSHGIFILTTRSRDIALDTANQIQPIIIHGMRREEGLELIRKRLPNEMSESLLLELLEVLEFIPLAITQALSFMVKRRKSVQQYLEQYRQSDATKTKLLSYEFAEHGRENRGMESVAKTWTISFEYIREFHRRASDLLCLISFFQHQGVPHILLQNDGEDEYDFEEAVAVLKAFSFIDADESDTIFSTHRLVQLATRWWLETEVTQGTDIWALKAIESVALKFPAPSSDPEPKDFKISEVLLPHAEVLLRYKTKSPLSAFDVAKAKLLNSSGMYIHWLGNYDIARSRFNESRELNLVNLGEKHVDTMTSTGLYGWTLANFDEDPKAIAILERLVEIRREVLGEDDPRTIDAMSDLASAFRLVEELQAQSEGMQREALARSKRVLGDYHGDTLNCMEHLAMIHLDLGQYEEAMELQRTVLERRKRMFGPTHVSTLHAENELAFILSRRGGERLEESVEIFEELMRKRKEISGVDHSVTLISINNFVDVLWKLGRREEARDLCARTVAEASNGPRKNNPHSQEEIRELRAHLAQMEALIMNRNLGPGDNDDDIDVST